MRGSRLWIHHSEQNTVDIEIDQYPLQEQKGLDIWSHLVGIQRSRYRNSRMQVILWVEGLTHKL